jgi:hypothetical protein
MFKVQGIQTQIVDVQVNLSDVVKALSKKYFYTTNINDVVIKDGCLCVEEDVSYHGSPVYEYRPISTTPELINLYEGLKKLNNFREQDFTK